MFSDYLTYYAAGLAAYKAQLSYASSGKVSESDLYIAFILYMALAITLRKDPEFSRLVIELNILNLIYDTYPDIIEPKPHWPEHLVAVQLLLRALLKNLDPVEDSKSIARLQELLQPGATDLDTPLTSSGQTTDPPVTDESDLLTSIRSKKVWYLGKT